MAVADGLARLGERLLRYFASQLGLLAKMGEECVQFGLDAHPHARQHDGDQRRQDWNAHFVSCFRSHEASQLARSGHSAKKNIKDNR
jgi:hypothetical protein